MRKRHILLSLVMVLILSACFRDKDNEEIKSSTTADLITKLDEYKKVEEVENSREIEKQAKKVVQKVKKNSKNKYDKNEDRKEESDNKDIEEKNSDIRKINIKAVGDIMTHLSQIQHAYNRGGGDYDFSDQFSFVSDFIKDSDISIGNYETTTNPNLEYAGFPRFNTPPALIRDLKNIGFDILSTANNHSMDTELEGVFTTQDAIKEAGLDYVGTMKDKSERVLYKDINGVRIAFLAYTYATNGIENLLLPREEVENIAYLSNPEAIKEDIDRAKAKGADFVVVYPHWGIEYQSYPDASQIELGRNMISWGADLVIGNHPHVVQPIEMYKSENANKGLIAYALGNFISLQSLENNADIRVEQAVALDINLSIDKKSGQKTIDYKPIPLWVGTHYDDYGPVIMTHIAKDFLDGGKYYDYVDENQRARIRQAYEMTMQTIKTEVE